MLAEILFWFHVSIIPLSIFAGLFLLLPTVIFVFIIHRLHFVVFGECLISRLQKYLGAMPRDLDFIQFAAKRLWGKEITKRISKLVDYAVVLLSISIAMLKHAW
ncbi:MAG: hypothetical protein A2788_01300 [Candidatus Abawacabacteria bacterium RIFCSPHIGHO2_01_FULL_46_8]|uniref:Uncharacterized protein n=1 Tax=Candidatus Abawacabacteria bacterium RIFCSPHIGHO2_01_FULL_46_8 TaxID=1817815 RepID=A0A1F4XJH0_9BACT|nr:MAG: hypothetical protein A2788_01300 [Candidatus Abawacabacteria bacterium RIFCSPHIGHO2_01_FULL_46_8]